jgi:hypothetical protein
MHRWFDRRPNAWCARLRARIVVDDGGDARLPEAIATVVLDGPQQRRPTIFVLATIANAG